MSFRFFLKSRKAKSFNYQPLYYDAKKEALEDLVERVKAEEDGKIPRQHEIKFDRKHGVHQIKRTSNMRVLAIIVILAAIAFLILR